MSDNQQPNQYDAVLGGQNQAPEGAAVLGGIEGVKQRLNNENPQVRIKALHQALNYGEEGIDLIIKALEDESWEVQDTAYLILSSRTERRIKYLLQQPLRGNFKLEPIEVVTVNRCGEIIQRVSRLARYFVEDLVNGINLEMAAIPAGTFIMGVPETEATNITTNCDRPLHEVNIPSFFMSKYPITQAQSKAVAALSSSDYDLKYDFEGDDRPVDRVAWNEGMEFCTNLSNITGRKYRLPSEAEWEYACRAGTTTPFHYGETITSELANYEAIKTYADEPPGEFRNQTTPVGQFPPNAFGLYDMHGNIWEWCLDDWYDDYKEAPRDGSPQIYRKNEYPTITRGKVIRGGSFFQAPTTCRSGSRYVQTAFYGRGDIKQSGLRVVCELK